MCGMKINKLPLRKDKATMGNFSGVQDQESLPLNKFYSKTLSSITFDSLRVKTFLLYWAAISVKLQCTEYTGKLGK